MNEDSKIPLKQMALKSKHQDVIFNQILSKWAKGKSISVERYKLKTLNENMKFKGGPSDRAYARLTDRPSHHFMTKKGKSLSISSM